MSLDMWNEEDGPYLKVLPEGLKNTTKTMKWEC